MKDKNGTTRPHRVSFDENSLSRIENSLSIPVKNDVNPDLA
jgi:hypothetical protein